MICFTVWWSLKVIIVLLHSLDKSRRLCVSVFTHYPVTVTKPTQQKSSRKFRGTETGQSNSFWSNQGSRCGAELHKATVRRCYSPTHGSLTRWHGQWLPGWLRAALRTHSTQGCSVEASQTGQGSDGATCASCSPTCFTKFQQTGRQNCTTVARMGVGWGFFQVHKG